MTSKTRQLINGPKTDRPVTPEPLGRSGKNFVNRVLRQKTTYTPNFIKI